MAPLGLPIAAQQISPAVIAGFGLAPKLPMGHSAMSAGLLLNRRIRSAVEAGGHSFPLPGLSPVKRMMSGAWPPGVG